MERIENREEEWKPEFYACSFPAQMTNFSFTKGGWVSITIMIDPKNRDHAIEMSRAYGRLISVEVEPWKNKVIREEANGSR